MLKRSAAALTSAVLCLALGGCALISNITSPAQKDPPARHSAARMHNLLDLDSSQFLPPPPAAESSAQKADEDALMMSLSQRDSDRGKQAARDMDMDVFWRLLERFGQVSERKLARRTTPETHALLISTWIAARNAARTADKSYPRNRPWVNYLAGDETCRPDLKAKAAANDSFASSFTARVWSTALAYAAVLPSHSEAVIREAMDITDSRWICGLGWKSDIYSGRMLGTVVYSRLSGEPDYQKQLRKARAELHKTHKSTTSNTGLKRE